MALGLTETAALQLINEAMTDNRCPQCGVEMVRNATAEEKSRHPFGRLADNMIVENKHESYCIFAAASDGVDHYELTVWTIRDGKKKVVHEASIASMDELVSTAGSLLRKHCEEYLRESNVKTEIGFTLVKVFEGDPEKYGVTDSEAEYFQDELRKRNES